MQLEYPKKKLTEADKWIWFLSRKNVRQVGKNKVPQ